VPGVVRASENFATCMKRKSETNAVGIDSKKIPRMMRLIRQFYCCLLDCYYYDAQEAHDRGGGRRAFEVEEFHGF
jgi:hypothetical protein